MNVKSLSHVRPSATPWTAAYQVPPPMGVLEWGAIAFSIVFWLGIVLGSDKGVLTCVFVRNEIAALGHVHSSSS